MPTGAALAPRPPFEEVESVVAWNYRYATARGVGSHQRISLHLSVFVHYRIEPTGTLGALQQHHLNTSICIVCRYCSRGQDIFSWTHRSSSRRELGHAGMSTQRSRHATSHSICCMPRRSCLRVTEALAHCIRAWPADTRWITTPWHVFNRFWTAKTHAVSCVEKPETLHLR